MLDLDKKPKKQSNLESNKTEISMHEKIQNYLKTDLRKGVWYNRPLWGSKSALQKLLGRYIRRPPVPEEVVLIHEREFAKVSSLATQAAETDNEKFMSKEFVEFLKIQQSLDKNVGAYKDLEMSIKFLHTAIDAKVCFEIIWQVEFRYRSSKQQEYYSFVDSALDQRLRGKSFQDTLQNKLDEIRPKIESQDGKTAIDSYFDTMIRLSKYELGLELLTLFKQYMMSDYVALRTVDDILRDYKRRDLTDFKIMLAPVIEHYDTIEKLAPIIQLPKNKTTPETFARILQVIALISKHHDSYRLFQKLMAILRKRIDPSEYILKIRQDYNAEDYQQPQQFSQDIPGESLYKKYQRWVTSTPAPETDKTSLVGFCGDLNTLS
jgi:hypothetical protein